MNIKCSDPLIGFDLASIKSSMTPLLVIDDIFTTPKQGDSHMEKKIGLVILAMTAISVRFK